jgi:alanyl aminopeptidase
MWGATGWPATRPLAWRFVQDKFDALVEKLPRDSGAFLPFVAVSHCDDGVRSDVERFFKDRAPRFTGGPRELAQALEAMRLCSVQKKSQSPAVARFLKKAR